MQSFPHHYSITAAARAEGNVTLEGKGLPALTSAPPMQFGGPGDRWSPETLLVAAVADCFVLTFRALATRTRLPWVSLSADVVGTLDRVDRGSQFTAFTIRVRLQVPSDTTVDQARNVLTRAEQTCLVSNSLKGTAHLETSIEVEETTVAPEDKPEAA